MIEVSLQELSAFEVSRRAMSHKLMSLMSTILLCLFGLGFAWAQCPVQVTKVQLYDPNFARRMSRLGESHSAVTDIRDSLEKDPYKLWVDFTVGSADVKAVKFKADFLDATGDSLGAEEYAEERHVKVRQKSHLGWNTKFDKKDTHSAIKTIKVWPIKVILADNSEWTNEGQACVFAKTR